jgi:hypothetical protein
MTVKKWLNQPGIVKKLQLLALISLSLNIFLLLNRIPQSIKNKPAQELPESKEEEKKQTSDLEIKNFLKEYLNYFFGTGLVARSFIEKNSDSELFKNELADQLDQRTLKGLSSNFNILDFYIETKAQDAYQIILVGIESFNNNEYQDREITMILELIYQDNNFKVQSIPKFEVKA